MRPSATGPSRATNTCRPWRVATASRPASPRHGRFRASAEWAFDGSVSPVHWLGSFARLGFDDARRLLSLGATCRQLPVTAAARRWDVVGGPGPPHRHPHLRRDGGLVRRARSRTRAHVGGVTGPPRRVGDGPLATPRHHHVGVRTTRRTPRPQPAPVPGRGGDGGGSTPTSTPKAAPSSTPRSVTPSPATPKANPNDLARRRADALVDVVRWYLDHNTDNKVARRRTHLDVIITIDTSNTGQGGELPDGTLVDAKTMARLAVTPTAPRHHGPIVDGARLRATSPHRAQRPTTSPQRPRPPLPVLGL